MSTGYWIAGGLALAFLAGGAGGVAVGKKTYGPSPALRRRRAALSRRMDELNDIMQRCRKREREIRGGRFARSHEMSASEKTYWKAAVGDAVTTAKELRGDHAIMTRPQLSRLRRLAYALSELPGQTPSLFKQAGIETPKVAEIYPTPAMLLGEPEAKSDAAPQQGGQKPERPKIVRQFEARIQEAFKQLKDWGKVREELKTKHQGFMAALKREQASWWAEYVKRYPDWANV